MEQQQPSNIRDIASKLANTTFLPNAIIRDHTLDPYAFRVLAIIASYDWQGGYSYSLRTLAGEAHCSRARVATAIGKLLARGLISATPGRRTDIVVYTTVDLPTSPADGLTSPPRTLATPRRLVHGVDQPSPADGLTSPPRGHNKAEKTIRQKTGTISPHGDSADKPRGVAEDERTAASPEPTPPAVDSRCSETPGALPQEVPVTAESKTPEAKSAPYRVFQALAKALGETEAEAAPRRNKAVGQAKVALRAVGEASATPEEDLCGTLAWLGSTMKPSERTQFLSVSYAAQRVAEWRKKGKPGQRVEEERKTYVELLTDPSDIENWERTRAKLWADPSYRATHIAAGVQPPTDLKTFAPRPKHETYDEWAARQPRPAPAVATSAMAH